MRADSVHYSFHCPSCKAQHHRCFIPFAPAPHPQTLLDNIPSSYSLLSIPLVTYTLPSDLLDVGHRIGLFIVKPIDHLSCYHSCLSKTQTHLKNNNKNLSPLTPRLCYPLFDSQVKNFLPWYLRSCILLTNHKAPGPPQTYSLPLTLCYFPNRPKHTQ